VAEAVALTLEQIAAEIRNFVPVAYFEVVATCWVKDQADKWNTPIVEAPKGRRDEFVDPYFKGAKPDQVVVIVKAREPAVS
jgi:hypothetical protein